MRKAGTTGIQRYIEGWDMNRREFIARTAVAAVVPFTLAAPVAARPLHQDGAEWFTNVEVKTHDGQTLHFYDDVIKGKIILINFFFTDCDAICPLMTENLARVQQLLAPRVGKDIFMCSISLQPEHDTPAVLAAYAKSYAVGPGWLFLTGKADDIELLRHRLGFVDLDPVQDADLEQHIGTVRIANEPMHRWSMTPALVNPKAMVRTVKRVIPERDDS
jgi:protein SCO1